MLRQCKEQFFRIVCGLILCFWGSNIWANNAAIGVIYPDVQEPYLSIYEQIRKGVTDSASTRVIGYAFASNDDIEQLLTQFKRDNVNKVVLLGQKGFELSSQLPPQINKVVGAYPLSAKQATGISMMTSPYVAFEKLTKLAPHVKKVYLVISEQNQWLKSDLKAAAKKFNLQLDLRIANSLKDSAIEHQQILDRIDPAVDAIWLPIDSVTMHDKIILPLVLKEAWDRSFVLFSSIPNHAKRGCLFSFYPDNYQLGKNLVSQLELGQTSQITVEPTKSILLAVNLRTAAHIGLSYTNLEKEQFNIVIPEQ